MMIQKTELTTSEYLEKFEEMLNIHSRKYGHNQKVLYKGKPYYVKYETYDYALIGADENQFKGIFKVNFNELKSYNNGKEKSKKGTEKKTLTA